MNAPRRLNFTFLSTVALTAALAGCSSTTAPGAVDVDRRQLLLVSSAEVEQMAAAAFRDQNQKAQAAGVLRTSGPHVTRVNRIVSRLRSHVGVFRADTAGWNWETAIIDQPMVNASVGPGGKITVYTGLIEKLNLSDDELAMVLGHEIAHALREHGRERVSQAAAQNVLGSVAAGVLGGSQAQVQMAGQAANLLYGLPNSRKNEIEADKIGLELAARAGFDPNASVTLWQKMGQANNGAAPPAFLSTHPTDASRIAELRRLIPTVQPLYAAARKG